jgi:hypothetical protein
VFQIDPSGNETVLFSFPCDGSGGSFPSSGVIRDSAGNLYGETLNAGVDPGGVVYMLDPNGVETVLYNFTGLLDNYEPSGGLLAGPNGVFFGMTSYLAGEVFAIKPITAAQ